VSSKKPLSNKPFATKQTAQQRGTHICKYTSAVK
jgi:hypothetical protein